LSGKKWESDMMRTMIRPLVAAALFAAGVPALANPAEGMERLVISTSGIDLSTPAGQKALDRRLEIAIYRLCDTQVLATLEDANAMDACRADIRAEVQPQVKAALLRTNSVADMR
jgi:UrcA family protein